MGIKGLLPFVKNACRPGNVDEFRGQSVVVDVSCLLHRGVFGCIEQIVSGQQTNFYIMYLKKYVDTLLLRGCHVILVFDGQPLPAKKNINDERRARREKNHQIGHQLLKEGLSNEAHKVFRQSTTVTREQVERTIEAFRGADRVDVLVAPYEADAQMTFLVQNGLAHAVVTEDSDLIAFGCSNIIFKLDVDGTCLVYDKAKLHRCLCSGLSRQYKFEMFRRICILAGCDYLQGGLQGVGLKKAESFFAKASTNDLKKALRRIPMYLKMPIKISDEFVEDFIRAENTFLHQIVFDPVSRKHRPLTPYPTFLVEQDSIKYAYAGEIMADDKALNMALGNTVDGNSSGRKLCMLSKNAPSWSIWHPKRVLETSRDVLKELNDDSPCPATAKRKHDEVVVEDDVPPQLTKKARSDVRMTRATKWIEKSFSTASSTRSSLSSDSVHVRRPSNGSTLKGNWNQLLELYGFGSQSSAKESSAASDSQGSSGYFSKTSQATSTGISNGDSVSSSTRTTQSDEATPTKQASAEGTLMKEPDSVEALPDTPPADDNEKASMLDMLLETPPARNNALRFEMLPETPPTVGKAKKHDAEVLPETPPSRPNPCKRATPNTSGLVLKVSATSSEYFSGKKRYLSRGGSLWRNMPITHKTSTTTDRIAFQGS
ncbi:XPG I-region family protein [Aphelenchoides avenae]|nr:XPG I-region family protein [Aphelenchus avenae]